MIRIGAFLLAALLAVACGVELHQRQLAGHLLITDDVLEQAGQELRAGSLDEAALLARFSRDTAGSGVERAAADSLFAEIERSQNLKYQARRFAAGALTGEPRDLAGFFGALSLDLFVVGDIRDIAVQGYREISGGDGDMLIMTLSALGLATTLSPQLDFAPALMKALRRMGAFSERFIKSLNKASRSAAASADFGRMGRIAGDFGRAARTLGPAPLARVMKHVEDPVELAHVSRLASRNPSAVFSLTRLTNGRAVKLFGKTADAGTLAKAARRSSRLGKIFAKAVHSIPDRVMLAVFLLACFAAVRILAGLIPRRRTRVAPQEGNRVAIPVLTTAVR